MDVVSRITITSQVNMTLFYSHWMLALHFFQVNIRRQSVTLSEVPTLLHIRRLIGSKTLGGKSIEYTVENVPQNTPTYYL
jgi:hypothetical protein